MDVKCDYCAGFFDDTLTECPHCGAANNHIRRMSEGIPKTIEELQQYCTDHKVPVQQMHFHIGEDYKGPKAFGIYRNGDQIVVYKNKADGSRAVRYSGRDEAYAVNEIFQKMRTEYNGAKEANTGPSRSGTPNARSHRSPGVHKPNVVNSLPEGHFKDKQEARNKRLRMRKIRKIVIACAIIFAIICIFAAYSGGTHSGYYKYNGNYYYNQRGSWYLFDTVTSGWMTTDRPADDISDYYESSYFSDDYGIGDFSDSDYYEESSYSSSYDDDDDDRWSSSWDDDDDWDYDSSWDWDSGSDWDSDW
ncbi:MAG: hypothetical protein K5697_03940 [Lachnospiraceae bacterium]|nr:hypothetical protein [Lachnospiraceae bacterium]